MNYNNRKSRQDYLAKLPGKYKAWLAFRDQYQLTASQIVCAYRLPYTVKQLSQIFRSAEDQARPLNPGKWIEARYLRKRGARLPRTNRELETLLVEQWKSTFKGRPHTGKPKLSKKR